MTWMLTERRVRRSEESFEALTYQLAHSRDRGKLEALVLADETGMVVASAGEASLCEELGAVAPLMTRAPMGMPLPPLLRGGEVAVRPVRGASADLFLACLGGGVARDALLTHSANGIARILVSN